jgi:putative ABC transport system substrate-binding protein
MSQSALIICDDMLAGPFRWFCTIILMPLALGVLALLPTATAQPRRAVPLIGVLEPGAQQQSLDSCHIGFQHSLGDLGYVDGQTITLIYRYAEHQVDRLPALAAELVQLAPDVLWTHSNAAALAAKQATTTIPIVVGVAAELLGQGLVASLARPGGNLTGMVLQDVELAGKRLELLKEALPRISRVAVLVNPVHPVHQGVPQHIEHEARALGVQLQRVEASDPEAFEAAFAAIVQGRAEALMIMDHTMFSSHRQRLFDLALRHRLPTIAGGRQFAEAGSLLAYGAYPRDLCQRSAVLVDKILKGTTPADLPVEQPTTFKLSVNLKTAQALGLTLPPLFLAQADEVLR